MKTDADKAGVGAHLEIAAAHTACITKVWTRFPSVLVNRTAHLVHHKVEAHPLGSLVHRRHGLETWRVLMDGYEEEGGHRMAAPVSGNINPRARLDKMFSEGRDLGDMLASRERHCPVKNCRMGRSPTRDCAPASYRGLSKVCPLAIREIYQTLRAHVRNWTLSQRTYDGLGRHMAHDTSAPMEIGRGRGKKSGGKTGKGKVRKTNKRKTTVKRKEIAQLDAAYFADECRYCD